MTGDTGDMMGDAHDDFADADETCNTVTNQLPSGTVQQSMNPLIVFSYKLLKVIKKSDKKLIRFIINFQKKIKKKIRLGLLTIFWW